MAVRSPDRRFADPRAAANAALLLALSVLPSAGLLLIRAYGPFAGGGWAALLVASLAAALGLVCLAARRGWSDVLTDTPRVAGGEARARPGAAAVALRALPWLALLPAVVALLGAVRIQISHHGFFHSAHVYQLLAGQVPPENPTLPGHPSNTYWPYHALVAGIVRLLGVPPPLASALLNVVLLVATVAWSCALVRLLYARGKRPGWLGVAGLFGVFGANLFGGLYWLAFAATGVPLEPRTVTLVGDVRLSTLLAKFVNFTGASLGIYFYVFVLYVLVRMLRMEARGFDLVLAFFGLLGALALHAITGAFMVVTFLPALLAAVLATAWLDGTLGNEVAALRRWLAALVSTRAGRWQTLASGVAMLLLGLPVLAFMLGASSEFPEPPRLHWPDAYALSVLAVSYPLLPFFLVGVAWALARRDRSVLFLAMVCLAGYALASVLTVSGRNEYKFIYLGSIPLCLVALSPITELVRGPAAGWRRLGRGAAVAALILVCWNVAVFGVGQLRGGWFSDATFAYEGRHVVARPLNLVPPGTGLEYADAFAWIRGHTSADTVIVVPMIARDRSALYVLSERVPYVVDGLHYNRGLQDFEIRAMLVHMLYGRQATPDERAGAVRAIRASLPDRPLVLVSPPDLLARFDPATAGLERLFTGRAGVVYGFVEEAAAGGAP